MTDEKKPESLLRLLWAAVGPAALVGIGATAVVVVLIAGDLRSSHPSLADASNELALPFSMVAMFISYTTNWKLRPRRSNPGVIQIQFNNQYARGKRPLEDPGNDVLVQPVFLGIGAACFGIAYGFIVISMLGGNPSASYHRSSAFWYTGGYATIFLLQALQATTRSARSLYTWGQERAAAAATSQADADRARMAALQAQMNPHFLFNALNTVAALLGTDGARAKDTVRNLSGMLKHTLARSTEPLTTVREEMQFVRDYLAIERERFGARMDVSYDLDPAADALAVPTMSLQPLVENAVKHAVTTRIEGGKIRISVSMPDERRLRLSVEDDGPGFGPDAKDGTGLSNVRQRLRTLYGEAATLDMTPLPSGARVTMTIPQQVARSDDPSVVHMKNEE